MICVKNSLFSIAEVKMTNAHCLIFQVALYLGAAPALSTSPLTANVTDMVSTNGSVHATAPRSEHGSQGTRVSVERARSPSLSPASATARDDTHHEPSFKTLTGKQNRATSPSAASTGDESVTHDANDVIPVPEPSKHKPKETREVHTFSAICASAGITCCATNVLATIPVACTACGISVLAQPFEAWVGYTFGGLASLGLGLVPSLVGCPSAGLGAWLAGGDLRWFEALFPAFATGLVGFAGGNMTIFGTFLVGVLVAEVLGVTAIPVYFMIPLISGFIFAAAMSLTAGATTGLVAGYRWFMRDSEQSAAKHTIRPETMVGSSSQNSSPVSMKTVKTTPLSRPNAQRF